MFFKKGQKPKITVIDDEKEFVETIKRFLESRNFEVSFAYGGYSGLEVIKSERPDLVLLDIAMFDMDGRDVLIKMRENIETQDTPVILLSGKGGQFDSSYSKELGADEYMTKPYKSGLLLEKINSLLEKKKKNGHV